MTWRWLRRAFSLLLIWWWPFPEPESARLTVATRPRRSTPRALRPQAAASPARGAEAGRHLCSTWMCWLSTSDTMEREEERGRREGMLHLDVLGEHVGRYGEGTRGRRLEIFWSINFKKHIDA
ncbi:hypothetical protein GQ55_1G296800 [Panicum hallii var. hallii]|uniref:Secreted protein n=1 Tax=Panicum hallii var. hallii TaxID=1504633 RepID=A0A2T7F8V9_9POAL|nr:hypothetical protein GQ55_1G296800 [Panicum hallii var. hallii]